MGADTDRAYTSTVCLCALKDHSVCCSINSSSFCGTAVGLAKSDQCPLSSRIERGLYSTTVMGIACCLQPSPSFFLSPAVSLGAGRFYRGPLLSRQWRPMLGGQQWRPLPGHFAFPRTTSSRAFIFRVQSQVPPCLFSSTPDWAHTDCLETLT